LATVSVVDLYRRHIRKQAPDRHYLSAARWLTAFWGAYAVVTAQYATDLGSLVEVVNKVGSLFYGGLIGVFLLAFFFPRVTARGAFYGVLAGEAVIVYMWSATDIFFLWFNAIGCAVVVGTGVLISELERARG
jgi:Na+/proline symporter